MTDSSDNVDEEYVDAPWHADDSNHGGLPFDGEYDHLLGNTSTPDGERLTFREEPSAMLMTVSADTTEARAAIEDLSSSLENLAGAAREVDEAMSRIQSRDLTISIDIETSGPEDSE